MTDYAFVRDRVARVREDMARAAERAGRDPAAVTLMGVTKFHPVEAVEAAWNAGIRVFGESRVQEAEEKFVPFLAAHPGSRLELIGHLQSNKARRAASLFSCVQSVDSVALVTELAKRARAQGQRLDVLLELHTGEESKAGFPDLESLIAGAEAVVRASVAGPEGAPALRLRGLMTMAPYTRDEAPIRASFRALRHAFTEVWQRFPSADLDVVSMGMTNDFAIAIEEGSTLVRVGTALFGERVGP